jgi:hypothetical protein
MRVLVEHRMRGARMQQDINKTAGPEESSGRSAIRAPSTRLREDLSVSSASLAMIGSASTVLPPHGDLPASTGRIAFRRSRM